MSFPPYPAYKDSGLRWLGRVPAHWTQQPLWAMFRRTKRTGHASEPLLSVYRDFGVIYKASRDDNFNKPSDDLGLYQLVEPGDLAINKMKAWQGSVAISEIRGIVSPAYFVYKSLHVENNEYLHYLFRSAQYVAGYFSISKGIRINQWDLEPEYHSRLPVLMPPPDEQRVIAAFLDRETARRLISATLPSGKVLDETAVRVLVGEERVQPPVVPTRPWRMSQPPLNPPLNRLS